MYRNTMYLHSAVPKRPLAFAGMSAFSTRMVIDKPGSIDYVQDMCDETYIPYSYRHHSLRLSAVRTVRSQPSRTLHTQETRRLTASFISHLCADVALLPRGQRLLSLVGIVTALSSSRQD
jgi:hypothetical protein